MDSSSRQPLRDVVALDEARVAQITSEYAQIIATTHATETAIDGLARLVVPSVGDWCVFFECGAPGRSSCRPVFTYPFRQDVLEEAVPLDSPAAQARLGVYYAVTSGEWQRTHDFAEAGRSPCESDEGPTLRTPAGLAPAEVIAIPVRTDRAVTGVIVIARTRGRAFFRRHEVDLALRLCDILTLWCVHARGHAAQSGRPL